MCIHVSDPPCLDATVLALCQSIMLCVCAHLRNSCSSTSYYSLEPKQLQLLQKRVESSSIHPNISSICQYHYDLYIKRYHPSQQCMVCESSSSTLRACPKWLCKQLNIDEELLPSICKRPCYEEKLSEMRNGTAAINPADMSHYTVTIEESSTPSKVRMHNTLFYTIIETHSVFIQHTTCSTKK